jgi:hypothetical protein
MAFNNKDRSTLLEACFLSDISQLPGSFGTRIAPLIGLYNVDCRRRKPHEKRRSALICLHQGMSLPRCRLSHSSLRPHPGGGGARRQAISEKDFGEYLPQHLLGCNLAFPAHPPSKSSLRVNYINQKVLHQNRNVEKIDLF